jgi:hypothetical protein
VTAPSTTASDDLAALAATKFEAIEECGPNGFAGPDITEWSGILPTLRIATVMAGRDDAGLTQSVRDVGPEVIESLLDSIMEAKPYLAGAVELLGLMEARLLVALSRYALDDESDSS